MVNEKILFKAEPELCEYKNILHVVCLQGALGKRKRELIWSASEVL
jgi:hypothetical protein